MTTAIAPTTHPCPSWCTLAPGHAYLDPEYPCDSFRLHPRSFGSCIEITAVEESRSPGELCEYSCHIDIASDSATAPRDLIRLARELLAAAEWWEAHR